MEVSLSDDGIRQTIGRCLQQFLGPTAEEAGQLIADQVRFLRWRALVKIVDRARRYTKENPRVTSSVPLKFLVPFVEQASLQDEDGQISEMWSKLLANARDSYDDRYVTFLGILNSLGPGEAVILKEMWRTVDSRDLFSVDTAANPIWHLENNTERSPSNVCSFTFSREVTVDDFLANGTIVFFFDEDNMPNMNELNFQGITEFIELQHLQALGLVWVYQGPVSTPRHRHYVLIGRLTTFGHDFVEACESDPTEQDDADE
jgi:hypothetical protein